jgi:hypothetical protein
MASQSLSIKKGLIFPQIEILKIETLVRPGLGAAKRNPKLRVETQSIEGEALISWLRKQFNGWSP